MRLIVKKYENGKESAYETSNDGGDFLGQLAGSWMAGERISAYLEALCDDSEEGLNRLQESLDFLADEIKKRRKKLRKRVVSGEAS